MGLTNDTRI
jgi:hypothetical protein